MQFKTLFKLFILLALVYLSTQSRFLQTKSQCCNQCIENRYPRYYVTPNMFKNYILEELKNTRSDDYLMSLIGSFPPEYTTNLLDVMEQLNFRKQMKLMTCEVNAGVNYEAYFGEFSNSTINAIFESIMASLDGNYGARDSTLTYTLINFVRKIRDTYNQKFNKAQGQYVKTDSRYEDAGSVAKNYAMAHAGMVLNMMNRDEQESVNSCFQALKTEEQFLNQNSNAYNPHGEAWPLDWRFFKKQNNELKGTVDFKGDQSSSQRYSKYFGRSKNYTHSCPRPVSIRQVWGKDPIIQGDSEPRRLYGDDLVIFDDSYSLEIELQRMSQYSTSITSRYYLDQMKADQYDQFTYTAYEKTSAKALSFQLTKEDSEVLSRITAYTVGNLLNCMRPNTLQKLRETCPGSCVQC